MPELQIFEGEGPDPEKMLLKSYRYRVLRTCLEGDKASSFSVTFAISASPGPQPLTSFVNKFQIPKKRQCDIDEYLRQS